MRHLTPQDADRFSQQIDRQTSKVPSGIYLTAAVVSMVASLTLKCFGKRHSALFVGQWAAPLMIMGVYDKLVHHDREH